MINKKKIKRGPGPKIRCRKCGDIIQSMYRHDFVWCSCKRVAVDGGGWYCRILFENENDFEIIQGENDEKK